MAQQTSFSPPKQITIDGQKYFVRTATTWNDRGSKGTIDTTIPPTVQVQYKPEGPFESFRALADRTGDPNVNNGWSFRPVAGPGFKKELVKSGPNSLTSQLDKSAVDQVAKDAVVPQARAQEALNSKTLTQTNKKLASGNQDPEAPAGAPPTNPSDANAKPVDAAELGKRIGEGTGRTDSYGSLIYPKDIADSQDKIRFTILQYKTRGVKGGTFGTEDISTLNARSSTEGRKELGTITLPIPGGIFDTNTVGWGDDRMDPFKMALANASLQAIMDGFTAGASVVSTAANRVTEPNTNADTAGAAGTLLASAAVQGDGGLLLSRTQGAVINPNLELLFSGPELRSFNFTFKMSARNKPEADMIVKIIRAFKQASAPQRTKSQLFVKAPNTFNIQYLHKTEKGGHTRIGRIKECALLSINTNYTPEGQYATYEDGTPISYEIQLQFKELEPIFNSDYEAQGITRNDIGY